jgi:hypothetical protein
MAQQSEIVVGDFLVLEAIDIDDRLEEIEVNDGVCKIYWQNLSGGRPTASQRRSFARMSDILRLFEVNDQ